MSRRSIFPPTPPPRSASATPPRSATSSSSRSPICPVSTRAEFEFLTWAKGLAETDAVSLAMVDVIAEKPLARGLTKELGIDHQSPQALWFRGGELLWHDSHGALTQARFAEAMGDAEASA